MHEIDDPMNALDLSWDRVRRAAISAGLDADDLQRASDDRWRNLLSKAIEAADRPDLWQQAGARRKAWRDHALARIAEWRELTEEGEGKA